MKNATDLRFAFDSFWGSSAQPAHPEPENIGPGPHSSDSDDLASWESAWIDLGGEG